MQHDRSSGKQQSSDVTDVRVMQAKIEMLFSALDEVKSIVKSVAETVAVIKVFDLQIKQQGEDQDRLELSLKGMEQKAHNLERRLSDAIEDLQSDLSRDIEDASKTAKDVKSTVDTQVAYLKGALAAITFLGAILYGLIVWQGGKYVDTIEATDRFIHTIDTLKVEDHLRNAMSDAPKAPAAKSLPPVNTEESEL